MAGEEATYYDMQELFMDHLPEDAAPFQRVSRIDRTDREELLP